MTVYQVATEDAILDLPDRFVVSPQHGRIAVRLPQSFTSEGEVVRAGDLIAVIECSPGPVEVRAPCDAWVLSFLARDGERVEPGAPIVHLREL
jgi:biotin carboxyl carrier protein